jgi:hypothetical protein
MEDLDGRFNDEKEKEIVEKSIGGMYGMSSVDSVSGCRSRDSDL